jgi:hypothetical protein
MFYNWDLINHTKAVRILFPSPDPLSSTFALLTTGKFDMPLALFLECPKTLAAMSLADEDPVNHNRCIN